MIDLPESVKVPLVPVWARPARQEIDTVVYSSRKAFLREATAQETLNDVNDVQLDRYYKQFMQGWRNRESLSGIGQPVGQISGGRWVGGTLGA